MSVEMRKGGVGKDRRIGRTMMTARASLSTQQKGESDVT